MVEELVAVEEVLKVGGDIRNEKFLSSRASMARMSTLGDLEDFTLRTKSRMSQVSDLPTFQQARGARLLHKACVQAGMVLATY